jgi:hypothetical protein
MVYVYFINQSRFIHTLWLIPLIDTYTLIDIPDWYLNYDWYTCLIHTIWLTILIDADQSWCMYILSIRVDASLILNVLIIMDLSIIVDVSLIDWHTWLIHTLWLMHLTDIYTMIDTADWYINHSVCINQGYQS